MSGDAVPAPVRLVAEFTARSGHEQEVASLLAALRADVRNEPGCVRFDSFQVASAPDGIDIPSGPAPIGARFVVIEEYRDIEAFRAHLSAPYGAEFNHRLRGLILESGSVLTFLAPV